MLHKLFPFLVGTCLAFAASTAVAKEGDPGRHPSGPSGAGVTTQAQHPSSHAKGKDIFAHRKQSRARIQSTHKTRRLDTINRAEWQRLSSSLGLPNAALADLPEDPAECRTADQCDVWREFETVNVDLHYYDTIRGIWADSSMKLELERVTIHGQSLLYQCSFTFVDQWGRALTASCDSLAYADGEVVKDVVGQSAVEVIKSAIEEAKKDPKKELAAKCAKVAAPKGSTTAHNLDQDSRNPAERYQAALRAFHSTYWGSLSAFANALQDRPSLQQVFHAQYPDGSVVEFRIESVALSTADVQIGNPKLVSATGLKESPCK